MPQKRTEKRRYPSRYSPNGYVTGAQLITELLLEKIAQRQKKDLPMNYWQTSEEWAKLYRNQICAANALLKKWPVDVILQALRDKRSYRISSLRASWLLEPILKEKLALYEAQNKRLSDAKLEPLSENVTLQQPQQIKKEKKSIFNILD